MKRIYINDKKPLVTWIIIAVTVAVYIAEMVLGAPDDTAMLVLMGAKYSPFIQAGQYWRLFTTMLLHGSLPHVGMNMLTLYLWGPTIEKLYDRWKTLAIYVIAGVTGTALSYLLSPYISVGASGAIFGLFGTLLAFGRTHRAAFKKFFGTRVILLVAINLAYGFMESGIDYYAHIGGLVGGYLAGEMLGALREEKSALEKALSAAAIVVAVAIILIIGPLV